MIKEITVFCGSSGNGHQEHKDLAIEFGKKLAQQKINICYGGMNAGLMYLTAEACLRNNGTVTGVIPRTLKDSERIHTSLSKMITVDTLWERKQEMFKIGDAFVALPGGYGTLDEALEILYWGAIGLHQKPMLFLNTKGYWDDIIYMLNNHAHNPPHAKYNFKDFMITADTADEAINKLQQWKQPNNHIASNPAHLPHFEEEIMSNNDHPLMILENRIDDIYKLSTALTLKQLSAHKRKIGILNIDGQYKDFYNWAKKAQEQTYITKHCLKLFKISDNMHDLQILLDEDQEVFVDLHREKWGKTPEF